jgi:hypothetical protein
MDSLDLAKVKQTVDDNSVKWYSLDLALNICLGDEVGHMAFRILCPRKEIGQAQLGISTA